MNLNLSWLLLASFGCSKISFERLFPRAEPAPSPVAPQSSESITATAQPAAVLRLPLPSDENDPLAIWLKDLAQPRLSHAPGLRWQCPPGDAFSLVAELQTLKVSCREVIDANASLAALNENPDCLDTGRLRVRALKRRCLAPGAGSLPPILQHLRLPELTGPYRRLTPTRLEPNLNFASAVSGNLLPIELTRADANLSLTLPTVKTWFAARLETGAVQIVIHAGKNLPADRAETVLGDFRSWVQREKKPLLLPFAPELNFESKDVARAAPSGKSPFYLLSTESRNPLYRSACAYLSSWIKARQILAKVDASENNRIELGCVVGWRDNPSFEPVLLVTSLPLPLTTADQSSFPVKSIDDARSLAVLQNLRAFKTN